MAGRPGAGLLQVVNLFSDYNRLSRSEVNVKTGYSSALNTACLFLLKFPGAVADKYYATYLFWP
jgi:hypothetical protein